MLLLKLLKWYLSIYKVVLIYSSMFYTFKKNQKTIASLLFCPFFTKSFGFNHFVFYPLHPYVLETLEWKQCVKY